MKDSEGIWMSRKGALRLEIIGEFLAGTVSRREAAELVGVKERAISRMARRYESRGLGGLEHGNRMRRPWNKISDTFRALVIRLVKTTYFDFNMSHCLDKLQEEHGILIRRETFRRWCHEKGLVKRTKRRKGIVRRLRERMPARGMLLQMDGSAHEWNHRDTWHLIHAIDDATSEIAHGEFFASESTPNTMKVLRTVVEKNGIPWAIYVDRAGCFGRGKRCGFNQFRRACDELGIRIFFACSSQAKGRVERANATFQDRLIPELRLYDIWTMSKANEYLLRKFLPNFWDRHCRVEPRDPLSKYRPIPSHIDLNEIFCLKYRRTVNGDHTVQWRAKTYQLDWPKRRPIRGHKVEFRVYPDGSWKCFHADDPVAINPVFKPTKVFLTPKEDRSGQVLWPPRTSSGAKPEEHRRLKKKLSRIATITNKKQGAVTGYAKKYKNQPPRTSHNRVVIKVS